MQKKTIKNLEQRIKTLENQLVRQEQKNITDEDVYRYLFNTYPEDFAKFVKSQMELFHQQPKGSRYSNDLKQFALSIYIKGPKAYKNFAKRFRFPSKATLLRMTQNWDMGPGFHDLILKTICVKVNNMEKRAKDCIICLDEMSIKSHLFYNIRSDNIVGFHETRNTKTSDIATTALVLMARGIAFNWKQPLAYFFLKSTTSVVDLKDILFEGVRMLNAVGLNVRAVVSDQGSNFYTLVKSVLKISPEHPYFMVDELKIVYIFDVPHLLKSTRNNFFSYSFKLPYGTTKKIYLEDMYKLDKTKQFRLTPRLTDSHLYPTNFQKMKVRLASQVFSHSVAVALSTYFSHNEIDSSSFATITFIEKMNELFDVLNYDNVTKHQAFMGSDKQHKILEEAKLMFQYMKILNHLRDITKRMKFIYGWLVTISSVLLLWGELKQNGYRFLYTRNLNQDCLENYFGQMRNFCGNARNPTPIQFARAFKKFLIIKFFEHTEGANCIDDTLELLTSISPESIKNYEIFIKDNLPQALKVNTNDYINLETIEGNGFVYVVGYLLKKCLQKHSCNVCQQFSESKKNVDSSTFFTYLKAFETQRLEVFGNLKTAPDDFVGYILELEKLFVDNFNDLLNLPNIGANLKFKFEQVAFSHPCSKFPINYLLSLYTRLRIYYTIKYANRDIKSKKISKLNPKLSILTNV